MLLDSGLAVQADGKILVAGNTAAFGGAAAYLYRLNADGTVGFAVGSGFGLVVGAGSAGGVLAAPLLRAAARLLTDVASLDDVLAGRL